MNRYRLNANLDWTEQSVRIIATPSPAAKAMFYYVQEVWHLYTLTDYFTKREHLE